MSRTVVLVSGGMDSLVTAAIALQENDETCFLHVNYGQRTESKELECFNRLCQYYRPLKSLVIDMPWLGAIGGSALTDINLKIKEHDNSEEIPLTYVPFRNANLIAAAVSWAEVIEADKVYIGAVEEDSSGYPDCREIFYQHLQNAITTGTRNSPPIKLMTPVIHLSKAEIVKLGLKLGAPFQYSWSCYRNSKLACGVCDSCFLRLRAFKEAGAIDPIPYQQKEQ
ncbi:MAG: 7-cyano-7-deazaguanine synthase QueC [Candidatus Cloacimonadaceae bacterium]